MNDKDIQIAGARLFDYIFDLFLIQNQDDELKLKRLIDNRMALRAQVGDAVVQLVRAVKDE